MCDCVCLFITEQSTVKSLSKVGTAEVERSTQRVDEHEIMSS